VERVTAGSYGWHMRVGLVGCVKTKVPHAAQARDLYSSALFRGRRAFVESTCDRWFIISAKHGLVSPDEVLEPYEETLNGKSTADKRSWAAAVLRELDAVGFDFPNVLFEIHARVEYRDFGLVDSLRSRGASVEVPAIHLSQGEQLAFYGRPQERVPRAPPARVADIDRGRSGGSYAPLADHLAAEGGFAVQLTFAQIERILGRRLPASARRYRAWWSNESSGSHSHAAAWMGSGWLVDGVDFNAGTVGFRRGRR
jgi:Family of unknown function (DUF6884)